MKISRNIKKASESFGHVIIVLIFKKELYKSLSETKPKLSDGVRNAKSYFGMLRIKIGSNLSFVRSRFVELSMGLVCLSDDSDDSDAFYPCLGFYPLNFSRYE